MKGNEKSGQEPNGPRVILTPTNDQPGGLCQLCFIPLYHSLLTCSLGLIIVPVSRLLGGLCELVIFKGPETLSVSGTW